jgi:hypothetical protein
VESSSRLDFLLLHNLGTNFVAPRELQQPQQDQWSEILPLNPGESDNFVLPHASLRQPLLAPEPTHGSGSARLWQQQSPAMAAGLTDHMWTLKEVLLHRVPPWPQPQTVSAMALVDEQGRKW